MKPYFERAGITLYHGNAIEVMSQLNPVDLVIADPPYEFEAHTYQKRKIKRYGSAVTFENTDLGFLPITEELREQVSVGISQLSKKWSLTFCQIEALCKWRKYYERQGLKYKRSCIWIKTPGPGMVPNVLGDRPGMGYETFIAMHSPGKTAWNGGGRNAVFTASSYLDKKLQCDIQKGVTVHPTQKPLSLIEELLQLFSNEGELVLDPFVGSGTTLFAARNLNRRAIGIEIEERYCEIVAKRLLGERETKIGEKRWKSLLTR